MRKFFGAIGRWLFLPDYVSNKTGERGQSFHFFFFRRRNVSN
jgi:hypothetical protein